MKIAILGCGPSGLVAAHAALVCRAPAGRVDIFSKKQPSAIYGAQYLHQPIPKTFCGHDVEPEIIRYAMKGEPESYLKKVYGESWDGTISDDLRDQAHLAWDLRTTYGELWMMYEPSIIDYEIPSRDPSIAIQPLLENYDMVVNTIPRPALCTNRSHKFVGTEIWALGETPAQPFPIECQENVITYNGDSNPSWYRASRIHGYSTVEWPGHQAKPPLPGIARVKKPLSHNCDCWGKSITHLGRMGRWQNGRLVHHVFADMLEQMMLWHAQRGATA